MKRRTYGSFYNTYRTVRTNERWSPLPQCLHRFHVPQLKCDHGEVVRAQGTQIAKRHRGVISGEHLRSKNRICGYFTVENAQKCWKTSGYTVQFLRNTDDLGLLLLFSHHNKDPVFAHTVFINRFEKVQNPSWPPRHWSGQSCPALHVGQLSSERASRTARLQTRLVSQSLVNIHNNEVYKLLCVVHCTSNCTLYN